MVEEVDGGKSTDFRGWKACRTGHHHLARAELGALMETQDNPGVAVALAPTADKGGMERAEPGALSSQATGSDNPARMVRVGSQVQAEAEVVQVVGRT